VLISLTMDFGLHTRKEDLVKESLRYDDSGEPASTSPRPA
jgi:hypothetical protein